VEYSPAHDLSISIEHDFIVDFSCAMSFTKVAGMNSKERVLRNYTFQRVDRFTIAPSQHLLTDISVENIAAMYDEAWNSAWLG
jgi:hypothetical protein